MAWRTANNLFQKALRARPSYRANKAQKPESPHEVRHHNPTRLIFGAGKLWRLDEVVCEYGNKAMIVRDLRATHPTLGKLRSIPYLEFQRNRQLPNRS